MKWRRPFRLVLVTSLLAFVGLGSASAATAPTFIETVVSNSAYIQENPETDGRYVVYEQTPNIGIAPLDVDIVARDLDTGAYKNLSDPTDNDSDQLHPDISADLVVWQSNQAMNPDIFIHNITWGSTQQLTNAATGQSDPRISGHYVVWYDWATDSLWWHDYFSPQYQNFQIPGSVGVETYDIDCDRVVFSLNPSALTRRLYVWNIGSTDAPTPFYSFTADSIEQLRLHYDSVAYSYVFPQARVGIASISDPPTTALALEIGADSIDVFHDRSGWRTTGTGNITVHSDTGWTTALTAGVYTESDPSLFGSRVVYERSSNNGDIILSSSPTDLTRTAGADRYATAVKVSQAYFDAADYVVLCTGDDFPDALAAAPWARLLRAPLLLTERDSVPDAVLDEIHRLGAGKVSIIGGTSVVTPAVEAQLVAAGLSVDRELQGTDRYDTAAKIAYRLYDALGADDRPFSGYAYFARGDSFADALAISPVAANQYAPILLVQTDSLPTATANVLKFLPIEYGVIAGSENAIDADVESAIEALLPAGHLASRWSGADRYATSVSVLNNALAGNLIDLDTVAITTGLNFPDALGGGAAMGLYGSPILLTAPNALPSSVDAVITQRAYEIGRADIMGGTSAVSDNVRDDVRDILP